MLNKLHQLRSEDTATQLLRLRCELALRRMGVKDPEAVLHRHAFQARASR